MIKGFTSSFKSIMTRFSSVEHQLENLYGSLSRIGSSKVGLDTTPSWLSQLSSGNALDALPWSLSTDTKRVLKITGHSLIKGDVLRFTTGTDIHVEIGVEKVLSVDYVLLDGQLPSAPSGGELFRHLRRMTPTLDINGNINIVEGTATIVDFLDAGALIPTGGNIIPRSTSLPLQVVASLAQSVTRMQIISDIGEFINLYSDAAGTILLAHLTLTPDEIVDIDIPAGTTLYIRNQKDVDINDLNSVMSVNFIG